MKKTFNKVLSVLMCIAMVFSFAPLSGFLIEAEAATYSGTCGDNLTWKLDTATGVLDISGKGKMTDWSKPESVPWYSCKSSVKTVKLGSSVAGIGEYAFYGCDNFTGITIPDSVTSIGCSAFTKTAYYNNANNWENSVLYISNYLIEAKPEISGLYTIKSGTKVIADQAFFMCRMLTTVIIPDSVTEIGELAFSGCLILTSVTIGKGVKSIGESALRDCRSLIKINVDSDNKSYSTDDFGVLFNKKKTALIQYPIGYPRKSYAIPDSVTSIEKEAFYNSSVIESITIPDSVTSIGNFAFAGCNSLTSITIPNFVTSMGESVFYECHNLVSITIPNSVTGIGNYMFRNCWNLESVIIGKSVESIGRGAFVGCDELTSITIPDTVKSIEDYAFNGCESLKNVYYDGSDEEWNKITIGIYNEALTNAKISIDAVEYGVYKVTINNFTIKYKESYKLAPVVDVDGDIDYTVEYTSTNPDVVTVDQSGNITTNDRGIATITCTATDELGNVVKDTCQVEIKLSWWQWIIWILLWGWAWY